MQERGRRKTSTSNYGSFIRWIIRIACAHLKWKKQIRLLKDICLHRKRQKTSFFEKDILTRPQGFLINHLVLKPWLFSYFWRLELELGGSVYRLEAVRALRGARVEVLLTAIQVANLVRRYHVIDKSSLSLLCFKSHIEKSSPVFIIQLQFLCFNV